MALDHGSKKKYDDQQLERVFPSWYIILYATACGFLIPWTIFLSIVLPPHYIVRHWDIAWAGFDSFEVLLFATSAYLAIKHSAWTALTSAMLGTALLVDAWFDILTARSHRALASALLEAFIVEIPLAVLSFVVSHRVFSYVQKKSVN